MYTKRQTLNKKWPIPRKGKKYVINPSHCRTLGVPVLIILRDILGIVKTRKEAKYIINSKEVLLNNKIVKKDNSVVMPFDVLSISKINKSYRLMIAQTGKFMVEELEKPTKEKICKVIGKKITKKEKMQLNLNDGRNVLTKDKINVGDSVILDFEKNSIVKCLPLKKGSEVLIISGKHVGKKGKVNDVEEKQKLFVIDIENKKIKMKQENLIVIK